MCFFSWRAESYVRMHIRQIYKKFLTNFWTKSYHLTNSYYLHNNDIKIKSFQRSRSSFPTRYQTDYHSAHCQHSHQMTPPYIDPTLHKPATTEKKNTPVSTDIHPRIHTNPSLKSITQTNITAMKKITNLVNSKPRSEHPKTPNKKPNKK